MDSANCVRFACGCVVFLCILWPTLLITGIVLMTTHNPQMTQMEEMETTSESFKVTSGVLEATGGAVEDGPGLKSAFAHTPVPGATVKSVYLETIGTTRIPENIGPNLGTVTVALQYKSQTFYVTSPPITLSRRTSKEVECEISYSSVCGSRTCCTDKSMTDRCNSVYSNSNAAFITNNQICGLGRVCGECEYDEHVASVCMVVTFSTSAGWVRDPSMSSCFYPFEPTDQKYAEGGGGAMIFIRSSDDPFIVLQKLSKGTMELDATNEKDRSSGRGILLCGIVAFLILVSLICLIHICHVSVCDTKALRRAMNLKVSDDAGGTRRDRKDQELLAVPDDGSFAEGGPSSIHSTSGFGDSVASSRKNPYGSRVGDRTPGRGDDSQFTQYSPQASYSQHPGHHPGAYAPPQYRDVEGPTSPPPYSPYTASHRYH